MTNLSDKNIWEALSTNTSIDLDGVPDEIFNEIKEIESEFLNRYKEIEDSCVSNMIELNSRGYETRKEYAQAIFKEGMASGVMFAMMDKKDYSGIIWSMLKPKGE